MIRTYQLPLPLRALRFAFHLVRIGQSRHLWHEVYSQSASVICWPLWKLLHKRPRRQGISLNGVGLAATSPDHLHPHGTKENTRRSFAFPVIASRALTGRRFLDVGCAHGALVEDMRAVGWEAVGLEGSDYNRIHRRGSWARLDGECLLTCDAEQPFRLNQYGKPWIADLITSWHVFEHFTNEGVAVALQNIRAHMHPNSVLIISTARNSDMKDGFELHRTQWTKAMWQTAFHRAGLHTIPNPFPRWARYRHSPDGLDFALSRRTMANDQ